ncbi:hypothetical protein JYU15_00680 [bacterium AH-315-I18]|nr:hypothetical protein [Phycisphaeraceae bacterium]MBN4060929.1 hypothetical protein [bacterium AH-315-I18]
MREIDTTDVKAVWSEVSRAAGRSQTLSFLSAAFTIDTIQDSQVTLAPKPGSRGFITEKQKSQLAQLISDVLGRPVNVQVKQKVRPAATADTSNTNGGLTERQLAMKLPLVQQISEHYDVSLMDVSDEQLIDEPSPDAVESDDLLDEQEQDDV